MMLRLFFRFLPLPSIKENKIVSSTRLALRRWSDRLMVPDKIKKTRQRVRGHEAKKYFALNRSEKLLASVRDSISTGGSIMEYHFLQRYILERQPVRILELGSGVTTVIIADALRQVAVRGGRAGHLHTMEDQPKYFEHAQTLCSEELRPYVTYHFSPLRHRSLNQLTTTLSYEQIPEGPYDLIYVDGPDADVKTIVDGDALFVLQRQPGHPADIVVDGRLATVELFYRMLPENRAQRDYATGLSIFRNVTSEHIRTNPRHSKPFKDGDAFSFLNV